MGDSNCDLLKHVDQTITCEFIDLMYLRMLYPLITRPAMVSEFSNEKAIGNEA